MGRELRKVPKEWNHPKREDGTFIAIFESSYDERAKDWDKECADWDSGKFPDYASEENKKLSYSEWNGDRPEKDDYMPSWTDDVATHYMMYETTSEGTPISPAFETPEELAKWLHETGASSFATRTASYKSWLRVCKGGYAPSAIVTDSAGLISGVEAMRGTE